MFSVKLASVVCPCFKFLILHFTFPVDVNEPHWAMHKKHVFILSEAGKPIYSRYVIIDWYNGLIFGTLKAYAGLGKEKILIVKYPKHEL